MYTAPEVLLSQPCLNQEEVTWFTAFLLRYFRLTQKVKTLQVAPALPKPVESAALSAQTEAEARRDVEASTGFSGRVQDWWLEYRRDTLSQQAEGVARLTASGEDGRQRPCCAFVRPLQLGRSAVLHEHVMLTLPAFICIYMAYQGHCTALQPILGVKLPIDSLDRSQSAGTAIITQLQCAILCSLSADMCALMLYTFCIPNTTCGNKY